MSSPFTAETATPRLSSAEVAAATPGVHSGAHWFFWIAGLSLINSVLAHSGSDRGFVIGLGFTLVADAVFKEVPIIAYAVDVFFIGLFVAFGLLGRAGKRWGFWLGAAIYALDAVIFISVQDWLPVLLHGLALFYIVRSGLALHSALRAAATPPALPSS